MRRILTTLCIGIKAGKLYIHVCLKFQFSTLFRAYFLRLCAQHLTRALSGLFQGRIRGAKEALTYSVRQKSWHIFFDIVRQGKYVRTSEAYNYLGQYNLQTEMNTLYLIYKLLYKMGHYSYIDIQYNLEAVEGNLFQIKNR